MKMSNAKWYFNQIRAKAKKMTHHYDDTYYDDRESLDGSTYTTRRKKPAVNTKKKMDTLTRYLCTVLSGIGEEQTRMLPDEIQEWWTKNQDLDKKRKEREDVENQIKELRKKLKELKK